MKRPHRLNVRRHHVLAYDGQTWRVNVETALARVRVPDADPPYTPTKRVEFELELDDIVDADTDASTSGSLAPEDDASSECERDFAQAIHHAQTIAKGPTTLDGVSVLDRPAARTVDLTATCYGSTNPPEIEHVYDAPPVTCPSH